MNETLGIAFNVPLLCYFFGGGGCCCCEEEGFLVITVDFSLTGLVVDAFFSVYHV